MPSTYVPEISPANHEAVTRILRDYSEKGEDGSIAAERREELDTVMGFFVDVRMLVRVLGRLVDVYIGRLMPSATTDLPARISTAQRLYEIHRRYVKIPELAEQLRLLKEHLALASLRVYCADILQELESLYAGDARTIMAEVNGGFSIC
ncbi:hypothetical protein RUND412_006849 [Rhizina undulata]